MPLFSAPSTALAVAVSAALVLLRTSGVAAETVMTGDIIRGYPVISHLDVADVPPQAVSRYWLQVGELNGGYPLHLPVFVARGPQETLETGVTLSLSGTVHGDELNPVRVVQRVFENLEGDVGRLNGTVIGIPTINPMGVYLNQRNMWTASSSGFLTNINRVFPGVNSSSGGNNADLIAYNLWNHVWDNASSIDVAIDLHTPSTGSASSLWCYADFRLPYVERLAKLLEPDTLKIDPGEPGSIETTFVEYNVPAITVEIGIAKTWLPELIDRTVTYVSRVMTDLYMLPPSGTSSNTTSYTPYEPDLSNTFIGTTFEGLPATYGGFVETMVQFDEDVTEGQVVALIRNVWGDVVEEIRATTNARIHQSPIDPSVEAGEQVLSLVYNSTDPECAVGCIV